jgi:hypothetical protein
MNEMPGRHDMNRRKFVFASTISLLVVTVAVAGLAFYSNFSANAFVQGVPNSINYFPADTKAIFGINVHQFVNSTVYTQLMQQHEQEIGKDLSEFIAKTGVDPRKDIEYIIAGGRAGQPKGAGAVIAVGTFKRDAIVNFINTQQAPINVDYNGAKVLMIPEANKLEKGIAFLGDNEIVLGDLDSLHAVLDVRYGKGEGINKSATMRDLLSKVSPTEMFWFAGDATLLANVPANTPFVPNLSAIQSVFGTLNLDASIVGKVTVIAKDQAAAGQLADFAKGLVALGGLASGQNPDLADLLRGIQINQDKDKSQFDISITVPFDLLQKLDQAKAALKTGLGK